MLIFRNFLRTPIITQTVVPQAKAMHCAGFHLFLQVLFRFATGPLQVSYRSATGELQARFGLGSGKLQVRFSFRSVRLRFISDTSSILIHIDTHSYTFIHFDAH